MSTFISPTVLRSWAPACFVSTYGMPGKRARPTCTACVWMLVRKSPVAVLVPPRVVHAYKCISEEKGLVVNLPDKLYAGVQRKQEVDEIRHEDKQEAQFLLD